MNTFEEVLAKDGKLVYKTKGCSMLPLLRQDKDLVIIETPPSRLKALDVALYKRGSSYILHRVIRVEDGYYLIRGDNTYMPESVPDTAVIGILTGFQRNGKEVSVSNRLYRLYSRIWNILYPLRFFCVCIRQSAVRFARRLGILPVIKKVIRRE